MFITSIVVLLLCVWFMILLTGEVWAKIRRNRINEENLIELYELVKAIDAEDGDLRCLQYEAGEVLTRVRKRAGTTPDASSIIQA